MDRQLAEAFVEQFLRMNSIGLAHGMADVWTYASKILKLKRATIPT